MMVRFPRNKRRMEGEEEGGREGEEGGSGPATASVMLRKGWTLRIIVRRRMRRREGGRDGGREGWWRRGVWLR